MSLISCFFPQVMSWILLYFPIFGNFFFPDSVEIENDDRQKVAYYLAVPIIRDLIFNSDLYPDEELFEIYCKVNFILIDVFSKRTEIFMFKEKPGMFFFFQ